jgi:branched-subunit amino acid aminotransferase/4-amino-4-deoxychorismate lyase
MSDVLALWLNGAIVPADRPAFLPLERGLAYGDGLFETLAVIDGRALAAPEHFARLDASGRALGFPVPESGALAAAVAACLAAAGPRAGALRIVVTRGPGTGRGYAPLPADGPVQLLVAAYPAPSNLEKQRAGGVRAAAVRGVAPGELARHKTLAAMHYVVALQRARAAGADEALLLDPRGRVLETAGANVFLVSQGRALTPPASMPLFAGLARARTLEWLGTGRSAEGAFDTAALARAEEAFLTGSIRGIVPLVSLDGRAIGGGTPGPITRELQERDRAWRASGP